MDRSSPPPKPARRTFTREDRQQVKEETLALRPLRPQRQRAYWEEWIPCYWGQLEDTKPKVDPAILPHLARMIAPRDRRNVFHGGILQIHLTRACDRACFNCTQGSNLAGPTGFMTPDQFRVAVESLKDYFGVVALFGGNPTLSPYFEECCSILRGVIPWERRGLWSNHPKKKGKIARVTFNPAASNLNVHQSREAWDEFARDWPESAPYLKGLDQDSRHSPPFVAMKDVIVDEQERWDKITTCDINREWSALIGVFRGQLRGWFCELAGAQSMLHEYDETYPDTGLPIVPGWWQHDMQYYHEQVTKHCHECGIPLKGYGALANDESGTEQHSRMHADVCKPKRPGRSVETVSELIQLGKPLHDVTSYIENSQV